MKHETVRASAFAMPLTNPAFPSGPYRYEFGLSAMRAHWHSATSAARWPINAKIISARP
jgi:acetoacetate decarboxylase